MHDYLLSPEWVRFAFVLGIAVSMLMYERRHLTTGSIVVPGYIAVFMIHPLVIVATFLNAFVTFALVNKVLRRYVLLYGRTKFTVLAVVSTLIQTAMLRLSPSGAWLWERDIPFFVGVGYIVPALIAHDMARQGIAKTTKSVLLAGVIVAVPIAFAIALDLPGVNELTPNRGFGTLAFPVQWLPIAVVVSIIASWAVALNYGSRSGGFIGAAFMGMFMGDPWQVGAALLVAGVSYIVVAKVLMRHMILFGRRKFSAMLLTSSMIVWPALWFGDRLLGPSLTEHFAVGSLALTPMLLPGLVANDIQRTSPMRVAAGLLVAGLCTVTTTWWIGATITGQHLHVVWKVMSTATILLLGWPQFTRLASATRSAPWATSLSARLVEAGGAVAQAPTRLRDAPARALVLARVVSANLRDGVTGMGPTSFGAAMGAFGVPLPLAVAERVEPLRSERIQPARPTTVAWGDWAREHPQAASEAEAWLDAALVTAVNSTGGSAVGTIGVDARTGSHSAPAQFDQHAVTILSHSIQGRGVLGPGFAPAPGWPRMPTGPQDAATPAPDVAPEAGAPTGDPAAPRSRRDDESVREALKVLAKARR